MKSLRDSLRRARLGILIVAANYALSVGAGMGMVHAGNASALAFRDSLVARAHRHDPAAIANDAGATGTAAALDFARNLGLAAVPETVGGLTLVLPIALEAYRGWVGGVVSVDGKHRSRLRQPRSALYYIATMLLQLSAFTLAGGAGLHLGIAYLRKQGPFVGPWWFRLPRPALLDAGRLYLLVVPLFAIGSLWEYYFPSP